MSNDNNHDDDDGKVGPGRPPRRRRFQKGISGNPRGRPKGRLNKETIDKFYYSVFIEHEVTHNGPNGPKSVSVLFAMLMLLRQGALNGDAALIERLLDRIERRAVSPPAPRTVTDRPADDEAILRRFQGRHPDAPSDTGQPDDETPDDAEADGDD